MPILGKKWQPDDLGDKLQLWYDASESSTIFTSGDLVYEWHDKSGHNRHIHQSDSGLCPVYEPTGFNNHPCLYFNYSLLTTGTWGDINFPFTRIIVFNEDGDDQYGHIWNSDDITSSNNVADSKNNYGYMGIYAGSGPTCSTAISSGIDYIRISYFDSSSSTSIMNGESPVTCDPGNSQTSKGITLGGFYYSSTPYAQARWRITEAILVSGALTETERLKLEGYLSNKWIGTGENSPLPSGHEYKNIAPSESNISGIMIGINETYKIYLGDNIVYSKSTPPVSYALDYLVVGGGGGSTGRGGGGGGGGFREGSSYPITLSTNYTVTVGAGGAGLTGDIGTPGSNGSDSTFDTITSAGGGGGGSWGATPYNVTDMTGQNGGCGGGGGAGWYTYGPGGTGNTPSTSPSQGYDGGSGYSTGNASVESCGGGGGGGAQGENADIVFGDGGDGGIGALSVITGNYYAGGGGGGGNPGATPGLGGTGGGGDGNTTTNAEDGDANTGGGGGGTTYYNYNAGNGGAGVVVLKFPDTLTISVGGGLTYSYTTSGSYYIYTFTAGSDTISFS